MASTAPQPLTIDVDGTSSVSALMQAATAPKACLVLAHGAGAGMQHPFMSTVALDLAALGIATLRYQFPYMERHGKRPDPPGACHATVRAAVTAARELAPNLLLLAGGKSFGGRMTSQAQAATPLPGVRGLVFFGFPLHAAKQPSAARGAHLARVQIPMLFLQGSRDALAELGLLAPLIEGLGARARLLLLENADHSFHVPARSGRSDAEVRNTMLCALSGWADSLL